METVRGYRVNNLIVDCSVEIDPELFKQIRDGFMPVIGPNYSDKKVKEAYDATMLLLKEKFRVQLFPADSTGLCDYAKLRQERNEVLYKAIEGLIELESWESW